MLASGNLVALAGLLLIAIVGYFVVGWMYDRFVNKNSAAPDGGLCPDPNCRHFNEPNTEYCARCGRPLAKSSMFRR